MVKKYRSKTAESLRRLCEERKLQSPCGDSAKKEKNTGLKLQSPCGDSAKKEQTSSTYFLYSTAQKKQGKNPGFFWSCFGLVLVMLCSCFAQAKADQKETKRRPEEEKNKTKTKDEPACFEIAFGGY